MIDTIENTNAQQIVQEIWNSREHLKEEAEQQEKQIKAYAESIGWQGYISLDSGREASRSYTEIIWRYVKENCIYWPRHINPTISDSSDCDLKILFECWQSGLISDMQIQSLNLKTGVLKCKNVDLYYLGKCFEFFGIDYEELKKDATTYQNGNMAFKLTSEQANKIHDFINVPWGETKKALAIMQEKAVRDELRERLKKDHYNPYYILNNKMEGNWRRHNINDYLIQQEFNKIKKEK